MNLAKICKNAHESIDFAREINTSAEKRCKTERENTAFWQNHKEYWWNNMV